MVNVRAIRMGGGASALGMTALPAWAEFALNLPAPVTSIAREIYDLHTVILWICAAIFVVVFVPMFYAIARHRKASGHAAAGFHDNTRLEILWTIVPVLILVAMAWPATRVILAMKDTGAPALTVKVTGHQWKWEYEYLGDGIRFMSNLATPKGQLDNHEPKSEHYLLETDRPLVVPSGAKVRLVLTASDVIHSWWVPALGVKQDAVPGFIRDAWFEVERPGIYRGQCAELCGVGHAYMPIVVEALPPEQFAAWREEQKRQAAALAAAADRPWTLAELQAQGEKVYLANCAACHQPGGAGVPGVFPALDGSKVVRGERSAHLALVFHGKAGTAMAAFGKQLSDADLAAVITYERNAWSNKVGDLVQPAELAALRK